jgi:hypothetical protein
MLYQLRLSRGAHRSKTDCQTGTLVGGREKNSTNIQHFQRQLLLQFPPGGISQTLSDFQFAPGKLEEPTMIFMLGPSAQQKPSGAFDNRS